MNVLQQTTDEEDFLTDLPSISALAAAEIDELLNPDQDEAQKEYKLVYLPEILGVLHRSLPEPRQSVRNLYQELNPISTEILSNSISEALNEKVESMAELVRAGKELETEIRQIEESELTPTQARIVLEKLKRFCLALSKYSMADRDRLETFIPTPDYQY